MRESLSIIIPVRDRQSAIGARTEALLELLGDLDSDLQLILVDDQSTDATPEILDDLRRKYPQIDVARCRRALGPAQAAEMALPKARGDFIFLHSSYEAVDASELLSLWKLRGDSRLVVARATTRVRRVDPGLFQRLRDWSRRLEAAEFSREETVPGLQMMRRTNVQALSYAAEGEQSLEVSHRSHRAVSIPKLSSLAGNSIPSQR
jgi:glycosyltransferase involved in cell wall biosynthesis